MIDRFDDLENRATGGSSAALSFLSRLAFMNGSHANLKRIERYLQYVRSGGSLAETARHFGVSPSRIRQCVDSVRRIIRYAMTTQSAIAMPLPASVSEWLSANPEDLGPRLLLNAIHSLERRLINETGRVMALKAAVRRHRAAHDDVFSAAAETRRAALSILNQAQNSDGHFAWQVRQLFVGHSKRPTPEEDSMMLGLIKDMLSTFAPKVSAANAEPAGEFR